MFKERQIANWVKKLSKKRLQVLVCNYHYDCSFTGCKKTKTLITFPEFLTSQGIIVIHKPLELVQLIDIIKIYKRINRISNE